MADLSREKLESAFTTYGADHEFAVATLRQSADEIEVVLQAMFNGCSDGLVHTALAGIAARMKVAALVAETDESGATL